jgi:hypothetical protein
MQSLLQIKVDTREFDRALKELAREAQKSLPEVVNDQAFRLANEALDRTKRANSGKMLSELGRKVASYKFASYNKKGKQRIYKKPARVYSEWEDTLMARIIQRRRKNMGKPPLWGSDLGEAAKSVINARMKSTGFAASGWLPAIRKLGWAARKKGYDAAGSRRTRGGVHVKGVDKGGANPAQGSSWNKSSSLWNSATQDPSKSSSKKGNIAGVIEQALKEAIAFRTGKILRQAQHIIRERFAKFGAKLAGV